MFNRFLFVSAILAAVILWGCGGKRMAGPSAPPPLRAAASMTIGQIVELKTGTRVSFDELIHSLASKDVVFIGEIHDDPGHHLIQIQILQALLDRWGSKAAVGMEFFPRTVQEMLDRYIRGSWTESEFLAAVDWEKIWGYDYPLYRPLMLAARAKSVRVVAINAPPAIVKKVAREGLAALSAHERSQIAADLDLGNKGHREFLQKAYGEHTHPDLKSFENFYVAQTVWEETMAETISSYLKENGGKMIVFTGNGHIIHRFGVPDRTARRIPLSMATVVPYPLGDHAAAETGLADYLWLTQACTRQKP